MQVSTAVEHVRGSVRVAALLGLLCVCLACASTADASTGALGVGRFTTTVGHAKPGPGIQTIPYFSGSFSFDGTSYPYYMVGTDPRTSHATTVVPTAILPLRFVFADGNVSDVGDIVSKTLASPIFKPAQFSSGYTQYGDAIRRAMFWNDVAGRPYHVLLGRPVVLPTITLHVPAGDGVYLHAGDPSGPPAFGFHVAADWFVSQFDSLLDRALAPNVLPIVLSRNVALSTDPIPYGAPTIGFHTAAAVTGANGVERIQTAIWASYAEPSVIVELPGILHSTDVLSHEVSEWLHDPFVNNITPNWESPLPLSAAIYGCDDLLETGDAASDLAFDVGDYQLQDEAFLSWFAQQTPSIGINGQYDYMGALARPARIC
jgi:hypothetical protein